MADSYKGGFVRGVRHGGGLLVQRAEAGAEKFVVEYDMGRLVSKTNVRSLEKELKPHNLQVPPFPPPAALVVRLGGFRRRIPDRCLDLRILACF
jgi:hypothetical protein